MSAKTLANVFIDTNILKFAAIKRHVYRPKEKMIKWGGIEQRVVLHERYTTNDLLKIKNDTQMRDAALLSMLAYAGISERLKFHAHREVYLESWGLPGIVSQSGRFFGCPIYQVEDPVWQQGRMIAGGPKKPNEYTLEFLSGIDDPRYIELTKMTGAYQGAKRPMNLNQALDAYHIWCAESSEMNYFLTMDYKLQRIVEGSKIKTAVAIKTPKQLLSAVLPGFGILDAIKFVWFGYLFSKQRVSFNEEKGWS